MKKILKRIFFVFMIVIFITIFGIVLRNTNFSDLEGYMISIASEFVATDSNATSTNAYIPDATPPNATSADVHIPNATPPNATSADVHIPNATPPNATSTNVYVPDIVNQNNNTDVLKNDYIDDVEVVNEIEDVEEEIVENEIVQDVEDIVLTTGDVEEINTDIFDSENEVSFLESKKVYIMILLGSVLVIIIVSIILLLDKKVKDREEKNTKEVKEEKDNNIE